MPATMSLYAMYQWDNTIFDNLALPVAIVKEQLLSELFAQTFNLEALYPDPDFFKVVVGPWSLQRLPVWRKLWETTQYVYDPIFNYDRTETRSYTENRGRNETKNGTRNGTSTTTENVSGRTTDDTDISGKIIESGNEATDTNGTQTEEVAAFNSPDYQPNKETTNTGTTNTDRNNTTDNDSTENRTVVSTQENDTSVVDNEKNNETTDENENIEHTETIKAQGNIGVTSTQQMIEQERAVVQFDVYQYIIDDIKERFCILVY